MLLYTPRRLLSCLQQGSVMDSFVPSGERGDGGIRDDGSTVDDEKLDVSMSIIECRIK